MAHRNYEAVGIPRRVAAIAAGTPVVLTSGISGALPDIGLGDGVELITGLVIGLAVVSVFALVTAVISDHRMIFLPEIA